MFHQPKKSLGQNFLSDGRVRRRIVEACAFSPSDTVLEIGPGRGALTPLIAERVKKVYAVELDRELAVALEEKYRDNAKIVVRNEDILVFDPAGIAESRSQKIKVFGNIPYYITSPIIERLIDARAVIDTVFLTVQKEFARRISASPRTKEYGAFSCYVQYYTQPRILFDIKKNSFFPVPRVDSSFIRLKLREKPAVRVGDEERLFRLVRLAFQQRRKTIRNSLRGAVSREALENFISSRRLDQSVRPEEMSLNDFAALADSGAR